MSRMKDGLSCSICKELYKNPVVHKSCGISFDRECFGSQCPNKACGEVIREEDLTKNYSLLQIVDEYRLATVLPTAYYLILLDTSTSMRYSDTLLPFAYGTSRSTYALQFLEGFFKAKLHSMTDKISLYSFSSSPIQHFDYETINETHLAMLRNLEFTGPDTALFDSIDYAVEKLQKMKEILGDQMTSSFVVVLTDGGNNFGKEESVHAHQIAIRSKRLNIQGYMVQLGDRNRRKTRLICDVLKYQFNSFRGGNVTDFVNTLSNSMRVDGRSRVGGRSRNNTDEQTTESLIAQLAPVPKGVIKTKELA